MKKIWKKRLANRLMRRKKGGLAIIGSGLVLISSLVMLGFLFINMYMVYETLNRAVDATDEGARIRAQAVDIPLKESYGIVEAFHNYGDQPTIDNIALSNWRINDVQYGSRENFPSLPGHIKIQKAGTPEYRAQYEYANAVAKQVVVDYVNTHTGNNANQKRPLLSIAEENICVDVQPIPIEGASRSEIINFSCTLKLPGGGDETVTYSQRIPVETNKRYVTNVRYYDDASGEYHKAKEYHVKNVVFVAAAYQYQPFVVDLFDRFIDGGYGAPTPKVLTSVAFPQVDECTTEDNCTWENFDKK